ARQAVEAPRLAVAGRRRKYQREITRRLAFKIAALETGDQLFRRAAADESGECNRVAVANDGYRLLGGHDLVLHLRTLRCLVAASSADRNRSTTSICSLAMSAGA